jgi:RHS repeat-associated protein
MRIPLLVAILLLAAIGSVILTTSGLAKTLGANNRSAVLEPMSPPVANDDNYTVHGGRLLTPLDNDSDPGQAMHIQSFTQPSHGTVNSSSATAVGYTAAQAYTGSDSFTYTVCDNVPSCATATVHITVVNQPPIAVTDNFTVHSSVLFSPLQGDTDPDPTDFIHLDSILTAPQHGNLVYYTGSSFIYGVIPGYVGADSFTYRICDQWGACDDGTVNFTIVNQTPVAVNDFYTVHGHQMLYPQANDYDPDSGDFLTNYSIVTEPTHGTLTFYTPGAYNYVAQVGYTGPDFFVYRICDQYGACTNGNAYIDIVNQTPIAIPDLAIVRSPILITPLHNDVDLDPGDFLHIQSVTQTQHGSLTLYSGNSVYIYNPLGYLGVDSFDYVACDQYEACSTGTYTLIMIGDGENGGKPLCNQQVGGPINVTNGNMFFEQSDYSLPGAGPAIKITRSYNSDSQAIGLFGRGWTSEYDEAIVPYDSNLVRLNRPDGRAIYFARELGSSGPLLPIEKDFHGSVVQNGSSGFTLTMMDGDVRQFNATGKLISLADRVGNQTTLAYDGSGKLTSVTDPFGRVLSFTTNTNGRVLTIADTVGTVGTYTYGTSNQLLTVTYADNSAFTFGYSGSLRLTTVTDALGNVVESHTYDGAGRAITSARHGGAELYTLNYVSDTRTDVTDALGHVTKYTIDKSKRRNVVTKIEGVCSCGGGGSQVQTWTYDDQLNVTATTDALNHPSTFTYDANGNRLTETNATGTVTYTYNQFGQVLTRTNQLSGVTTYTYDTSGNVQSVEDALHNSTNLTHDSHGQLLTVTDARGKVTTYTWDTSGRMTQAKDALNQTTDVGYDARARVTTVTNALSQVRSYEYDAASRLKKITFPDSNFVSYTYDLAGRRTKTTDPRGNDTTFAYDNNYRLTTVTDADSNTTTIGYDLMSNPISQIDELGRETNYEYDDFNRLKKVIRPPATTGAPRLQATIEYDAAGNIKKKIDTAGRETTFAYDSVNRMTSTIDADNKTTSIQYDVLSRTTAVVDALAQTYAFAYDPVGRRREITRGGVSKSLAYDDVGNLIERTDYNGATTNYTYDDLNRLSTITYPDATGATFTYTALSRVETAANENGTVSFAYNNRGRIESTTDVFNHVIAYAYDANGNRTSMTVDGSPYADYSYDALNRMTDLSDSSAVVATYAYDATGNPTSRTLLNGVVSTYEYDGLSRLTRLRDDQGATSILDNQYTYTTAQQIREITELSGTKAYQYDLLDRLLSGPSESYTYDAVGNRTTNGDYTYGAPNRLATFGGFSYTYDANGNQVSKLAGSEGVTRTYDFENRLTQVDAGPGAIIDPFTTALVYKYDALGRRIERSKDGEVQKFVYDGQDALLDLDEHEQVAVTYLNGPGLDNKIRQTDRGGNLYYTTDHLRTTRALTEDSGSVVEEFEYDSFGNSSNAGRSRTRFTYTGREYDTAAGLYYYRARFYDPQVGRFISEDPIGLEGGINPFVYCLNDPIRFVDPYGEDTLQIGVNISGIWGIGAGSATGGIAIDDSFHIAGYYEGGLGIGTGAKVQGGLAIHASDAPGIEDLQGIFGNGSVGAGKGIAGSIDGFHGDSPHGKVTGGGVTLGAGLGLGWSVIGTYTGLLPIFSPDPCPPDRLPIPLPSKTPTPPPWMGI